MTFSENVDTTTTDGSGYAVTGGLVSANTDPAGSSNTMTLTISGITDTSATPTVTYTQAAGTTVDTTANEVADNDSAVATDSVAPTFVTAIITATDAFVVIYSEPVLSTNTGHYTVDSWGADSTVAVNALAGSGIKTILVDTDATDSGSGVDTVQFDISTGVTDLAGNAITALSNQQITADFVQPILTSTTNDVMLSANTLITAVSATSVDPNLNLSGLTGGVGTATFPSFDITLDTETVDIIFPSGVVASNLPSDEIIEVFVSTKTANTAILPAGETAGTIVELGDPLTTITFSAPVKVTLTGQSGNTPFIVTTSQTILVSDCTTGSATVAPTLTSIDPTNSASHCAIDAGTDLIIWTRHFTGFGSSSISSSGSGSSGGDSTKPSLKSSTLSSPNSGIFGGILSLDPNMPAKTTSFFETGDQVDIELSLYENSGLGLQHIALYTDLRDKTLYDSELWVIYEKGQPITVHDPNGFWEDDVDVSEILDGTKVDITFHVTFAKSMGTSDIIIRAWDQKRNSIDILFEDAWKIIEPQGILDSEFGLEPEMDPEPLMSMDYLNGWVGYSSVVIGDSEFLSHIEIDGDKIPSWFKKGQVAKWVINEQISQQEFVDALRFLSEEGLLT